MTDLTEASATVALHCSGTVLWRKMWGVAKKVSWEKRVVDDQHER
jgi:hypothetical protein